MASSADIMIAAANAVAASEEVKTFCVEHFGKGLQIIVNSYTADIPSEKIAPYLWIYADGDTEVVKSDANFVIGMELGANLRGEDGERFIKSEVSTRTATANGVTVCGEYLLMESLADIVQSVIRNASAGAIVTRITRRANNSAHQPLEWANFSVEYLLPTALGDVMTGPAPAEPSAEEVANG